MEWKYGSMEADMRVHMTWAENQEKESTFGKTEATMMEIGLTTR